MIKWIKRIFLFFLATFLFGILSLLAINYYVKLSVSKNILTMEEAVKLNNIEAILVLGCQVKSNGEPSAMLSDRVNKSVELYNFGVSSKILMSGDNRTPYYNEVGVMKEHAVHQNVLSNDIFLDHDGYSTYDSIYRASEVFQLKKVVIVTQQYHLYRALFIAKSFGIDAYGVSSDGNNYVGQSKREFREILARIKDFFWSITKPLPEVYGDLNSVYGNGDLSLLVNKI